MATTSKAETIITTTIPSVTRKAIVTYEKVDRIPPYTAYGRKGKDYKTGVKGVDIPNCMLQIASNTNATWLWWTLVSNRDVKSNIVVLEPKNYSEADVWKIKRGRKVLEEMELITRYKNNHYLLNPKAVFPLDKYYEEVCNHWFMVTNTNLNLP